MRDPIELRSREEIARIREVGRLVQEILQEIARMLAPGLATAELDRLAESRLRTRGARPAFKGYQGFPASICVSVNSEVVHGIPSPRRHLAEGDLVSLDFGAELGGWYGDAALTLAVGRADAAALRLMDAGREALARAIEAARPGARLGDVGAAVQGFVEELGYSVVDEFVGHGIGRRLHEPPAVPNYGVAGTGLPLRPGMVLAIEPMVNEGGPSVRILEDGWTAVTEDGLRSVHFEHTVAITEDGPRILTLSADGDGGTKGA